MAIYNYHWLYATVKEVYTIVKTKYIMVTKVENNGKP